MNTVFVNGELIDRDKAKIDIEDRGYQFGDGIYEVIRVYNGKTFTMKEHMERLYQSAEKMKLSIPYNEEEFTATLLRLIEMNGVQDGIVYLQVTRGVSARQHHFPSQDVVGSVVAYTKDFPVPKGQMEDGVTAKLVEDIRWLRCDIKSLNLLGNLLAKQEAASEGHFEAILHRGDTVTEGSSSNAFMVKDGVIYTHPATNLILNGITRRVIEDLSRKNGITFQEKTFSVPELLAADEVFIASTTSEVMPVTGIDGKVIGEGRPGAVTKRLQALFGDRKEIEAR
ncbi:D-amino-acid transaminase [Rossellomorea sp. YZS02]|uniref:D-amino-acid transaminase n=1 Tax=Rossellomorea sp. YZS02 TaxID=3097358 RepID=UPI002A0E57AB|nr:D-amino-acid transaminase [Rossellomorea sp. YZS02]MDX8345294.1 D-amino-acid transaminase [Rossellomorea sp. YZS02]